MSIEKQPAVYITASRYRGTIYTGVTSNLYDRIAAHIHKLYQGFSADYDCHQLVWYENHETMPQAIKRETQIKAWKRGWKIELIEKFNRHWLDLHDKIECRPLHVRKAGFQITRRWRAFGMTNDLTPSSEAQSGLKIQCIEDYITAPIYHGTYSFSP